MLSNSFQNSTSEMSSLTDRITLYSRFFELLERTHSRHAEENQSDLKKDIQEQIMRDLEEIYLQAKAVGNMTAALKAKELQGKNFGMFGIQKELNQEGVPVKSLASMNLDDLNHIISTTYQEMGVNGMDED